MYTYYVKLLLILWPVNISTPSFEDVPQIVHTNKAFKFDNTIIYRKAPLTVTKILNK